LLSERELAKYKANLIEIATRAKTQTLSSLLTNVISATKDKRKLSCPKKVTRVSKIINMPQKPKNIIKPESEPEEVRLVIGSDFNNKEHNSSKKTLKLN
jgi:hypothetical protein